MKTPPRGHLERHRALRGDGQRVALDLQVDRAGVDAGQVEVLYMTNEVGNVGLVPDGPGGEKAFRCVADPLN